MNKCDLPPAWDAATAAFGGPHVEVSLKTGAGLAVLREALLLVLGRSREQREAPLISNVRHEELLRRAGESVDRAITGLRAAGVQWSEDFVLADLQVARAALEEVTGKRSSEELLDHIFSRFCVGK